MQPILKFQDDLSCFQVPDVSTLNPLTLIDLKKSICELMDRIPLGSLDNDAIFKMSEIYPLKGFWESYRLVNYYFQNKKSTSLQKIEELLMEFFLNKQNDMIMNPQKWMHKWLIKQVYLCGDEKLIELFQTYLPLPPLSIFDSDNQPQMIVQREHEKAMALAEFKDRNASDPSLEEKVISIQRKTRSGLLKKSTLERIENRYFLGVPNATEKAALLIEDANTPYRPKECSPQLADRLLKAASQVKLFHSVYHLLDPNNIVSILDGCLFGRRNLVMSCIPFRPAALAYGDIDNGDENVICLGPDEIDEICLVERTIGLELDVDLLIKQGKYQKNETLFFKQRDLCYNIDTIQSIAIGNEEVRFCHTKKASSSLGTPLQLFNLDDDIIFFSEVEKDLFISSNMQNMHQILSLNFFRFLDTLMDLDGQIASGEIKRIYDEIDKLNDIQLQEFMLNLGKKMSCTCEFNIYGAHKINLDALRSITIYQNKEQIDKISIDELCKELNRGDLESLNRLKQHVPEIFSSTRFTHFITSKVPKA